MNNLMGVPLFHLFRLRHRLIRDSLSHCPQPRRHADFESQHRAISAKAWKPKDFILFSVPENPVCKLWMFALSRFAAPYNKDHLLKTLQDSV
jgi:hypothetical protein